MQPAAHLPRCYPRALAAVTAWMIAAAAGLAGCAITVHRPSGADLPRATVSTPSKIDEAHHFLAGQPAGEQGFGGRHRYL
jgi:hypothetical protein